MTAGFLILSVSHSTHHWTSWSTCAKTGECVGHEQLWRFMYIPVRQPLKCSDNCPFKECGFKRSSVEGMLQCQTISEHAGWPKDIPRGQVCSWHCEGVWQKISKWAVLSKQNAPQKNPCLECPFPAATVIQLRKHMLVIDEIDLGQQEHWVSRRGRASSVNLTYESKSELPIQCSTVEDMLHHQATSQHPGWSTKYPPGALWRVWQEFCQMGCTFQALRANCSGVKQNAFEKQMTICNLGQRLITN